MSARRSRICGNQARIGGGAHSDSGVLVIDSTTIARNNGGALSAADGSGDKLIANSTISGNRSGGDILSFHRIWPTLGGSLTIVNSTISDNTSTYGAIMTVSVETASIVNSTIAFNRQSTFCEARNDTMLFISPSLHLDSTIIANNTCGGDPANDLGGGGLDETVVEGANNLIGSSDLALPPDTLSLDPDLAPLVDNGGPTQTHALLDGSPAIDAGNNAAGLAYDQRGPGYPRVKGAQADIGAYER